MHISALRRLIGFVVTLSGNADDNSVQRVVLRVLCAEGEDRGDDLNVPVQHGVLPVSTPGPSPFSPSCCASRTSP